MSLGSITRGIRLCGAAALLVSAAAAQMPSTPQAPKPLGALECRPDSRIIVAAGPVAEPFVAGVTRTDWLGALSNLPMTGVAGFPGSVKTEDLSAGFKQGVSKALAGKDLQAALLERAKQALAPQSSCSLLFTTAVESARMQLAPTDVLIGLGFYFWFQGSKPKLNAMLGASQVTGAARIGQIEAAAEKINALSATMQKGGIPDVKTLSVLTAATGEINKLVDGGASLKSESAAHKSKEWLADNGALVRSELDAALDKMLAQIAGMLFPGK
jgi:hypothetical protein